MASYRRSLLCVLLALCCGCASYSDRVAQIRSAYYANGLESAETLTDKALQAGRTDADVLRLEQAIDEAEVPLPPLKNFVLPGGPPDVAALHLARTVARRAERRVLSLSRLETVRSTPLVYLNRLADLLFVLARRAGHENGAAEVPWAPRGQRT